jgi:glucosamine-6-phosphate deaminase
VRVYDGEQDLGRAATPNTADVLRDAVAEHGSARVIIATGNSQRAFVAALRDEPGVPWGAVTVFHMDEYVGIGADHSASFRRWIRENVAEPFGPAEVHYIDGDAADPQAECRRYEELLRSAPLDLVCLGIGENGHIAFNEPHQADFDEPVWVKIITLQDKSRHQQVGEGHFATLDDVPEQAITLTVPALLAPRNLQVVTPEARKAEAVRATLTAPVDTACPATVLRSRPGATLFLDRSSAGLLDQVG